MPPGCPPLSRAPPLPAVAEWQKSFEERLGPLLAGREALPEEEAQRLGRKDPEQELEKFVTANTQELGKDKWLCPLSGKKFKVRTLGGDTQEPGRGEGWCPLSRKKLKVGTLGMLGTPRGHPGARQG